MLSISVNLSPLWGGGDSHKFSKDYRLLSVTGHFPLKNKNQAGAELRQARSSLGKLELSLIRHRL